MSWVKQKATPNLKEAKAETIVARPSLWVNRKHQLRQVGQVGHGGDGKPDDIGNAGDVDVPGGERGGHRGLCH